MATMQQTQDSRTQPTPSPQLPTRRFDGSTGPRVIGPRDGKFVHLGSVGVRFMIWGAETGGSFSLVEHPIPPHTLCAPLHRHAREDEYSYVLEGRMGALLGDEVVYAEAGDLVFKPRDQGHTFWNAGDEPCRILEIISPSGFEHFFRELGDAIAERGAAGPGDILPGSDLPERYAIEFQPERTAEICERFGVGFPGGRKGGTAQRRMGE
jgi:mannose-6-phosphate isomerase-like protein (cupin superfamily)